MIRNDNCSERNRQRRYTARIAPHLLAIASCCLGSMVAPAAEPATRPLPPVVHADRPSGLPEPVPRNAADLRAIETRVRAIVDRVRQCTVGIIVGDAQGSGVIVSDHGLVLTAAHVVMTPGRKVIVVLSDGRHLEAHTLGVNFGTDCGAVQIADPGPFPACKLSDMQTLRVGDWCVATGHPGGYQEGRSPVVRLGRFIEFQSGMLQSDCPLLGGDSGGPLFDLNGNVIGIHSRIGARTSLNLHVPVALFLRDWDRLTRIAAPRSDGESQSMLGLDGQDDPHGARVTLVFPRSPADQAGLKTGDVVTTFDGQNVAGFQRLQKLIQARRPGSVVKLRVVRDQSAREVRATIAARPRE